MHDPEMPALLSVKAIRRAYARGYRVLVITPQLSRLGLG